MAPIIRNDRAYYTGTVEGRLRNIIAILVMAVIALVTANALVLVYCARLGVRMMRAELERDGAAKMASIATIEAGERKRRERQRQEEERRREEERKKKEPQPGDGEQPKKEKRPLVTPTQGDGGDTQMAGEPESELCGPGDSREQGCAP